MQQQSPELNIKIDVNTLNVILAGLDELPAKISRRLMDELVRQAQEQIGSEKTPQGPLSSKVIN